MDSKQCWIVQSVLTITSMCACFSAVSDTYSTDDNNVIATETASEYNYEDGLLEHFSFTSPVDGTKYVFRSGEGKVENISKLYVFPAGGDTSVLTDKTDNFGKCPTIASGFIPPFSKNCMRDGASSGEATSEVFLSAPKGESVEYEAAMADYLLKYVFQFRHLEDDVCMDIYIAEGVLPVSAKRASVFHFDNDQYDYFHDYTRSKINRVADSFSQYTHIKSEVFNALYSQIREPSFDTHTPRTICQAMAKTHGVADQEVDIKNYVEVKNGEFVVYTLDRDRDGYKLLFEELMADILRMIDIMADKKLFINNVQDPIYSWTKYGR